MKVVDARAMLTRGHTLAGQIEQLRASAATLRGPVEEACYALREQMVRRELSTIPVARLKDTTSARLRFDPLEQLGITTVLHVYGFRPAVSIG